VAEVGSEPLGRTRRRSSAEAGAESEPWGRLVGRSGVRRLLGLSPSPSPGSGGAEFAVFRGLARVRALCNTPGVYIPLDNEYGFKHVISVNETDVKF
jgi:hypothetical protein